MSGFAQDFRYALRGLRKSRGFTITAVLTLALGIGANTAVFSVLNAVLLRPLPYHAPERLAMLFSEVPTQGLREGRTAYGDVEEWRRHSRAFVDMAVLDPVRPTLTTAAGSEPISVDRVSSNYFSILGVQPAYGRTFSSREADERQRLALISHDFWQSRFAGSLDTIGRSIVIDGLPSRIIGVMPADLRIDDTDVWEPNTLFPNWEDRRRARGAGPWFVIARLQPHVTFEQAQAEMSAIAQRLSESSDAVAQRGISVVPLSMHVTGSSTRAALWMLTGAVSFVLLMAIANIAGPSLARGAARDREIAIRAALGATRARIVRQLLIESVTLAAVAGLAGLMVALATIRMILSMRPPGIARLEEVGLDPVGFGWALTLALFSGVLVGVAPAMTVARRDLKPAVEQGGRGSSSGASTRRLRRVLVVGEFALAIVLLVGAGLLTRSLLNVHNVDPGFSTDRVISMQLASPVYPATAGRVAYFERVLDEAKSVAGVESAAIASEFFIGGNPEQAITIEGSTRIGPELVRFRRDEVSADFFETIGAPLIRGRGFSARDGTTAPRVAIVNQSMARRLWPQQDPVGKRFRLGPAASDDGWFTVVGVVGDMRRRGLEHEPIAQMFEPLAQNPSRLVTLLVRTSTDPRQKMEELQAVVRRVATDAPVYGVTTLEERLGALGAQRRFQTLLLIAFALAAMLLAAIGIYGLMRYSVATRTREIAIRIAVGAERRDIVQMILREGLSMGVTGLLVGLMGAVWLAQLLSGLVFGITATDPLTFVTVSMLLTSAAAAACYFPARRAARINPVDALKYE